MPTKITFQAKKTAWRLPIDRSALVVVLLLSLVFALAITAAIRPQPLVDPGVAAVQGGL